MENKPLPNPFDALAKFVLNRVGKPKKEKRTHTKHAGSKNHSKKASKTRRMMAKKSRRINRKRNKKG
jgi:hypothetical protein